MNPLIFRPKLAWALWKLYQSLNHISHCGWKAESIDELSKHYQKLARLDHAFWHHEFNERDYPADPPPSRRFFTPEGIERFTQPS